MTINLVGKLLKTAGCYYYMCPCCTGLRIWSGDGWDFSITECTCWKYGSLRSSIICRYVSVRLSNIQTLLARDSVYPQVQPGAAQEEG